MIVFAIVAWVLALLMMLGVAGNLAQINTVRPERFITPGFGITCAILGTLTAALLVIGSIALLN